MADEESQPLVPGQNEGKRLFQKDVLFFLAVLTIMGIPMIVIGHLYLSDCKVQPYIPIFLLVWGYIYIFTLLLALVMGMGCCCKDKTAYGIFKIWSYLMLCFIIIWCIVGSVWVYRAVKKVDYEDITSEKYCNKTLYDFTWWILTFLWPLLAFIICIAYPAWVDSDAFLRAVTSSYGGGART